MWRYLHVGNFEEKSGYEWLRPYRGSDLTLVLGQMQSASWQAVGSEAKVAQKYIQDEVGVFIRDPVVGLSNYGWERYQVGGELFLLLHIWGGRTQEMKWSRMKNNLIDWMIC